MIVIGATMLAYSAVVLVRVVLGLVRLPPSGVAAWVYQGSVTATEPILLPLRSFLPPLRTGASELDLAAPALVVGLWLVASISYP